MENELNQKQKKNPHQNHKKRMRERFIACNDFSGFAEHEIIELLLNFSIVRKNTNNIAHELCDTFGSLDGILNADFDDLMKIKGISECTATFLKMQYSLLRYYNVQKAKPLRSVEEQSKDMLNRLMPIFSKLDKEHMYMITADSRGNIRKERNLATGSASSVSVAARTIVEAAVKDSAVYVFLAHNHPNGYIYPSQDDINFTFNTKYALKMIDIDLVEHYIIGDNSYYPILKNKIGQYKSFIEKKRKL